MAQPQRGDDGAELDADRRKLDELRKKEANGELGVFGQASLRDLEKKLGEFNPDAPSGPKIHYYHIGDRPDAGKAEPAAEQQQNACGRRTMR